MRLELLIDELRRRWVLIDQCIRAPAEAIAPQGKSQKFDGRV